MVEVRDRCDYGGFRVAELVGLEDVVCQLEDILIGSGIKFFVRQLSFYYLRHLVNEKPPHNSGAVTGLERSGSRANVMYQKLA